MTTTAYAQTIMLRRPQAHIGQDTAPMPRIVIPAAPTAAVVDMAGLDLCRWTAVDLILLPAALLLAGTHQGTHRRDRHSVRRRGMWLRAATARPATAPDTRGTWRGQAPNTAGWDVRGIAALTEHTREMEAVQA